MPSRKAANLGFHAGNVTNLFATNVTITTAQFAQSVVTSYLDVALVGEKGGDMACKSVRYVMKTTVTRILLL